MIRLSPVTIALLFGCANGHNATDVRAPEVLLHLPDDRLFQLEATGDSALFASSTHALFRTVPAGFGAWERVAVTGDEFITRLFAPTRNVVFALTRRCNAVFQWDPEHGWHELETPIRDSVWVDGDTPGCFHLADIWGRNERDVYVAGSRGLLMRYDGDQWRIEPTFTSADSSQRQIDPSQIQLWTVNGDDTATYAGSTRHLLRRSPSGWQVAATFSDELPSHCEFSAPVPTMTGVVLGWNDCILRFDRHAVSLVTRTVRGIADGIYRGRRQQDGSALFWSYSGDLVVVRGAGVVNVRVPNLGAVGGAVSLGPDLFVAGMSPRGGQVVRVNGSP